MKLVTTRHPRDDLGQGKNFVLTCKVRSTKLTSPHRNNTSQEQCHAKSS